MTSEILFQENTEIDSIQQMITTIHNHIAEYRSNLSRRPNVYRPKIAELQANLAQIYWYDYKDYHSAEKLFLQALENYEKYSGRRIIIQSHKLKIMDFLVNLYNVRIVWNFPNKYYCECWKYKRNWQKTIGGFTSKM